MCGCEKVYSSREGGGNGGASTEQSTQFTIPYYCCKLGKSRAFFILLFSQCIYFAKYVEEKKSSLPHMLPHHSNTTAETVILIRYSKGTKNNRKGYKCKTLKIHAKHGIITLLPQ